MTRDCEYYETLMSRALDGELSAAETDELQAHIRACPHCSALYGAFSAETGVLREDDAEPPDGFAADVMARVLAGESAPQGAARRMKRKPVRRRRALTAAACLALVLVGAYAYLSGMGGANTAARYASVSMDASLSEEASLAESALDGGTGGTFSAADGAGYAAVTEDAEAEAEYGVSDAADADYGGAWEDTAAAARSVQNAAVLTVPEGREADFQALITDAGYMPEGDFHVIASVEYRGVIYEFLTDEEESCLLWRDAAEGLSVCSLRSVADLWAVLG